MAGALLPAPLAAAPPLQVDCDTPDDFCIGFPSCVTEQRIEITVPSCNLDFGGADLELAHEVSLPAGGTMVLEAFSIVVADNIDGKGLDGAHVTLIAASDVGISDKIDVRGRSSPGSILIQAGGNVGVRRKLDASTLSGATATGGTVVVEAGGTLTQHKHGSARARGNKKTTAGGTVMLSGLGGVTVSERIDVRGSSGGAISVSSPSGSVSIERKLRAEGQPGAGGTVDLSAAGNLVLASRGVVLASGGLAGAGTISLDGADVDAGRLSAIGRAGGAGGSVTVLGETVSVDHIDTQGRDGGAVDVSSTAGGVTLGRIKVWGGQNGGTATVSSAANADVAGPVAARGGTVGGEFRVSAVGDLTLGRSGGGLFKATGQTGGVIEGQAGGNLTAQGTYVAAVGGCIGLSAGGTLDVSNAIFDVPLVASCP